MKTSHNSRARHAEPMDLLRSDLAAIRQDVTALVNGRMSALSEETKAALSSAGEAIRDAAKRTSEQASMAHRKLADTAGERPITTILVAAGAGIVAMKLLGWMLRR